jgi:hypothetical protein
VDVVAEVAGAVGCGGGVEGVLAGEAETVGVAGVAWVLADQALVGGSRGSSDQTVAVLTHTAGIVGAAELTVLNLTQETLSLVIELQPRGTFSTEISKDAGIAVGHLAV